MGRTEVSFEDFQGECGGDGEINVLVDHELNIGVVCAEGVKRDLDEGPVTDRGDGTEIITVREVCICGGCWEGGLLLGGEMMIEIDELLRN